MNFIKTKKQSWKQLCFLFFAFFLFCSSCTTNNRTSTKQILEKISGDSFSISYTGTDEFKHGHILDVNGKVFVHDSLYLFKENKSFDTVWLPTKKYVAVRSSDGGLLYDYITPLAVLMKINDNLRNDTVHYLIDASKLLIKGELIIKLKKAGTVQVSKNYPLLIQNFSLT